MKCSTIDHWMILKEEIIPSASKTSKTSLLPQLRLANPWRLQHFSGCCSHFLQVNPLHRSPCVAYALPPSSDSLIVITYVFCTPSSPESMAHATFSRANVICPLVMYTNKVLRLGHMFMLDIAYRGGLMAGLQGKLSVCV